MLVPVIPGATSEAPAVLGQAHICRWGRGDRGGTDSFLEATWPLSGFKEAQIWVACSDWAAGEVMGKASLAAIVVPV